jgi:methylmalonyl-CoA mutase
LLIANLLKAHDLEFKGIHLIAEMSGETTGQKDPYTNILRLTTSNISAILGGCDSLVASQFTDGQVEFATRIAKNIQLMLKHEAHLNKVANPAGGSYFIEQLSTEISKKAWIYFKELEQSGGFAENIKSGKIQKDIRTSAKAKLRSFQTEENILIGVNKYPNPDAATSFVVMAKKESVIIEILQPINYAQFLESEN